MPASLSFEYVSTAASKSSFATGVITSFPIASKLPFRVASIASPSLNKESLFSPPPPTAYSATIIFISRHAILPVQAFSRVLVDLLVQAVYSQNSHSARFYPNPSPSDS